MVKGLQLLGVLSGIGGLLLAGAAWPEAPYRGEAPAAAYVLALGWAGTGAISCLLFLAQAKILDSVLLLRRAAGIAEDATSTPAPTPRREGPLPFPGERPSKRQPAD